MNDKPKKERKFQVIAYLSLEEKDELEQLIAKFSTEHWKPSNSEMIKIALKEMRNK